MSRRILVRACVVTFSLGVALGVPASGSAKGPSDKPQPRSASTAPADSQASLNSPAMTDPLGRKAR
jgi:hypothetical protein